MDIYMKKLEIAEFFKRNLLSKNILKLKIMLKFNFFLKIIVLL